MKNLMGGFGPCGDQGDRDAYCCGTQKKGTCQALVEAGCAFIVGSDGTGCPPSEQ